MRIISILIFIVAFSYAAKINIGINPFYIYFDRLGFAIGLSLILIGFMVTDYTANTRGLNDGFLFGWNKAIKHMEKSNKP